MRGTVERDGSGWRYRVELARDPATGRRYSTKGAYRTERKARRALNRVPVAIDDGMHVARTRIVASDYLTEWFARARVDLMPTTADRWTVPVGRGWTRVGDQSCLPQGATS
jgi:hypothetical protein